MQLHTELPVSAIELQAAQLNRLKADTLQFLEQQLPAGIVCVPPPLQSDCMTDLLFTTDRQDSVVAPTTITLSGLTGKSITTGAPELTTYTSVAGCIFVSDEMPLNERKLLSRQAKHQLRRFYPGLPPECIVMTMDRRWLQLVKLHGLSTTVAEQAPRSQIDYGSISYVSIESPQVSLFVYEPGHSHIGGTTLSLRVRYLKNDLQRIATFDAGKFFKLVPGWSGMGSGPSYAEGILPFLERGSLAVATRLYDEQLLRNSVGPRIVDKLAAAVNLSPDSIKLTQQLEVFITLELSHRHSPEYVIELLKQTSPRSVAEYERRDPQFLAKVRQLLVILEAKYYRVKSLYDGLLLSHGHQDHTGVAAAIRPEVPFVAHETTRAIAMADARKSDYLTQGVAVIRQRDQPKVGSTYPILERPYYTPPIGQRFELAPHIFITAFNVYHSIPGCLGFFVEVEDQRGKIVASFAYPGDYRTPSFFDELSALGRKVDLLFMEGTNPPGVKKESASVTEADVKQNFEELLKQREKQEELLIVDLVKDNFERLRSVVSAAQEAGRVVVISPNILDRVIIIMQNSRSAENELSFLREQTVAVWRRTKASYSTAEKELFANRQTVTTDDIVAQPGKYVLLRTSSESPEQLSQLAGCPTTWVRSAYGPYDHQARTHLKYLHDTAAEWGWQFVTAGFHATGHAQLLRADDQGAEQGIIAAVARLKPGGILVGHTERRGLVSETIRGYPGLADVKIHDRIQHPDRSTGHQHHEILLYAGS